MAQRTIVNILWLTIMEKNILKEYISIHITESLYCIAEIKTL